jgi:hypothetical protein
MNALGDDSTDVVRLSELDAPGETDRNGKAKMEWFGSIPNDVTVFEMNNNIYHVTDALENFYASKNVGMGAILTDHIQGKLSNPNTAFVEKEVTLADIPDLGVDLMNWHYDPNGANKTKTTTDEFDYDRRTAEYWTDQLDCSYETDDQEFLGSDGIPVGDPNWNSVITGIEVKNSEIPVNFALKQNYPNPFNPSTKIEFSIAKSDNVKITVFDVLGKSVNVLVDEKLNAGSYTVDWNGENQFGSKVTSGIYFYRMDTESKSFSKKMLLLK